MPILLAGAGGHARACIDVIEAEGRFAVAGLIGVAGEVGAYVLGYPVIGTDADLEKFLTRVAFALVTVGQIKTADPRVRIYSRLEQCGYGFPTIVSPRAHVSSHATVGGGTIIMHGAIVNAAARVGNNCIINSNALIEHDAIIEDHCHISTAAAINSGVRVGARTFVGSNASVRQGLSIGKNCVIGMGQKVLSDCSPGTRLPAAAPLL
jgi:sugar O-acyltransferase (sialic acid O-acetyltransferase NeuD family)